MATTPLPAEPDETESGQRQPAELEATHDFVADANLGPQAASPQQLGEFRLLRELGRGGMGALLSSLGEKIGEAQRL
ncbi:MAG TPA: hypothetical protein VFI31_13150 [Pirellulales bacterium]|nr:hypothetical protein [Pirellulales bacterium]